MNLPVLEKCLAELVQGKISVQEMVLVLRDLPFENLGFARLDHHRVLRNGIPEVIFCEGKTIPQIVEIFDRLVKKGGPVLATRATPQVYERVKSRHPRAIFHQAARTIRWGKQRKSLRRKVWILSGGTSDFPVVAEMSETLTFLGVPVHLVQDVGVAGLHRLLSVRKALSQAALVIVVAGMEGALASVVAGLVHQPVIAVPTSVGYGANFKGLSALLAMMSSCVPGVGVVNIDGGFNAAVLAYKILKR